MLRSVSGYLFGRLAKVLKQDSQQLVEQSIANNLPTKRGEFNPYQVFDFLCCSFFCKYFIRKNVVINVNIYGPNILMEA